MAIEHKHKCHFTSFDICQLYPNITEELLHKAISYAEKYVNISKDEKEIFFHTSKAILYHRGKAWVKKGGSFSTLVWGALMEPKSVI